MLLKVVDEIEEVQRVEGPPSHRALAEEDDATLVAAVQSGRNGQAFEILFHRHRSKMRFVSRFGCRR